MAALGGSLALVLVYLARLPPRGVRELAQNPAYTEECGTCHDAYHPSLLPAASWQAMMAGLEDHFGEEVRNRFRTVDPAQPLRVTATPYWRRRHAEIPVTVFARASIRTKTRCSACHRDAATGRFDDQAIAIPKE